MKSFEYELIYLDEGSNPSTSTVFSQLSGDHPIDGQPEHVVKLFIRACLVLTDRGSKYEISEFDKSEQ